MCIALSAFHVHVPCTGCVMALFMILAVMKTQRYVHKYLVIVLQSSSVQPINDQGFQACLM
jgi:3-oxoacyl-[acyl-carrier-protein] synthase III